MEKALMTLTEAAKYLRVPESTFRFLRPKIGGSKVGRKWVFTEDELNSFVERGRVKSTELIN
jgi:excisionase family DNA binding protein